MRPIDIEEVKRNLAAKTAERKTYRGPTKADIRKAEARRRLEDMRDAQAVERSLAEVWEAE